MQNKADRLPEALPQQGWFRATKPQLANKDELNTSIDQHEDQDQADGTAAEHETMDATSESSAGTGTGAGQVQMQLVSRDRVHPAATDEFDRRKDEHSTSNVSDGAIAGWFRKQPDAIAGNVNIPPRTASDREIAGWFRGRAKAGVGDQECKVDQDIPPASWLFAGLSVMFAVVGEMMLPLPLYLAWILDLSSGDEVYAACMMGFIAVCSSMTMYVLSSVATMSDKWIRMVSCTIVAVSVCAPLQQISSDFERVIEAGILMMIANCVLLIVFAASFGEAPAVAAQSRVLQMGTFCLVVLVPVHCAIAMSQVLPTTAAWILGGVAIAITVAFLAVSTWFCRTKLQSMLVEISGSGQPVCIKLMVLWATCAVFGIGISGLNIVVSSECYGGTILCGVVWFELPCPPDVCA